MTDEIYSSQPRSKFERLSSTNYELWINHVRDHLLSEELGEVYDCSELEVGEDGDELNEPAAAAARNALQKKLGKMWSFLRIFLFVCSVLYTLIKI